MKYLIGIYLLMICVYANAIPPSPAGGGYFQIYQPGDYAYVKDHDDFDFNFHFSEAFTIELWFYQKRSMKQPDRLKEEPGERWYLINKSESYDIRTSTTSNCPYLYLISPIVGNLIRCSKLPLNQWHYAAFTVDIYRQSIINTQLIGKAKLERTIFIGILNSLSSLQIGGGVQATVGNIPNEPFFRRPFWTPFTGGLIDEIRISNINRYPRKEIDQESWKETIVVPTGPFKPDEHTVALWHFDYDGTPGSKWRDASGNGHHLTYSGDYLNVEPYGKLATTWGQQKKGY